MSKKKPLSRKIEKDTKLVRLVKHEAVRLLLKQLEQLQQKKESSPD